MRPVSRNRAAHAASRLSADVLRHYRRSPHEPVRLFGNVTAVPLQFRSASVCSGVRSRASTPRTSPERHPSCDPTAVRDSGFDEILTDRLLRPDQIQRTPVRTRRGSWRESTLAMSATPCSTLRPSWKRMAVAPRHGLGRTIQRAPRHRLPNVRIHCRRYISHMLELRRAAVEGRCRWSRRS